MLALHLIGWLAIGTGGIAALYGATEGDLFFLASGLTAVVSGILYLALARGLDLLADIRDRLTPAARQPDARHAPEAPQAITEPAGSLQDLEQRLAALKGRQPGN